MFKDVGNAVGRYLQVLGWSCIIWMVVEPFVFDNLRIDLMPFFAIWAGAELRRHNPTARKWTLAISGLYLVFIAFSILYVSLRGLQGIHVRIGALIKDPTPLQMAIAAASMALLAAFPFVALMTRRARAEFGAPRPAD